MPFSQTGPHVTWSDKTRLILQTDSKKSATFKQLPLYSITIKNSYLESIMPSFKKTTIQTNWIFKNLIICGISLVYQTQSHIHNKIVASLTAFQMSRAGHCHSFIPSFLKNGVWLWYYKRPGDLSHDYKPYTILEGDFFVSWTQT